MVLLHYYITYINVTKTCSKFLSWSGHGFVMILEQNLPKVDDDDSGAGDCVLLRDCFSLLELFLASLAILAILFIIYFSLCPQLDSSLAWFETVTNIFHNLFQAHIGSQELTNSTVVGGHKR